MAIPLIPVAAAGLGAFFGSKGDDFLEKIGLQKSPADNTPEDTIGSPTPFQLATYTAVGLGLWWLYRKARKA